MNTTTELTIEQVLAVRVRAAQSRAAQRKAELAEATIEVPWATEQANDLPNVYGPQRVEKATAAYDKAHAAWTAADSALALAEQEVKALQGEAQPVPYDPATHGEIRRYAVVLWEDDLDLEPADALKLAREAERLRSQHYYDTYVAPQHADEDPNEV